MEQGTAVPRRARAKDVEGLLTMSAGTTVYLAHQAGKVMMGFDPSPSLDSIRLLVPPLMRILHSTMQPQHFG